MKNLKNYIIGGMIGLASLGIFGNKSYGQENEDINQIDFPLIDHKKLGIPFGGGTFKYDNEGNLKMHRILCNDSIDDGLFENVIDLYFKEINNGQRVVEKIVYYNKVHGLETLDFPIKKNPYMIRYSREDMKKYFDEKNIKDCFDNQTKTLIKYDLEKVEVKKSSEQYPKFKEFLEKLGESDNAISPIL